MALDALSLYRASLIGYASPTFLTLHSAIRKAKGSNAPTIPIAPFWQAPQWFPDLRSLSHVPPLELSPSPDLLGDQTYEPRDATPARLAFCGHACQH